jgi:hypothetical protein
MAMHLLTLLAPDPAAIEKAIDRLTLAQQKGTWDYISISVGLVTLGALIWYTVETRNLRKVAQSQLTTSQLQLTESHRQTEFSNRPILVITLASEGTNTLRDLLVMRNIGTAPAFNIAVSLPFGAPIVVIRPPDMVDAKAEVPIKIAFKRIEDHHEVHAETTSVLDGYCDYYLPQRTTLNQFDITYAAPDRTEYKTTMRLCHPPNPHRFEFQAFDRVSPIKPIEGS